MGVADRIVFYDVPPVHQESIIVAVAEFSDDEVEFPGGEAWAPTANDHMALAESSGEYVKKLGKHYDGRWQVGGTLVMLGLDITYEEWIQQQDDYASGFFSVEGRPWCSTRHISRRC
jgi:hypothetical protein